MRIDATIVNRDTPCKQCDYNLRFQPKIGRCPECGTAISFTLPDGFAQLSRAQLRDWRARLLWLQVYPGLCVCLYMLIVIVSPVTAVPEVIAWSVSLTLALGMLFLGVLPAFGTHLDYCERVESGSGNCATGYLYAGAVMLVPLLVAVSIYCGLLAAVLAALWLVLLLLTGAVSRLTGCVRAHVQTAPGSNDWCTVTRLIWWFSLAVGLGCAAIEVTGWGLTRIPHWIRMLQTLWGSALPGILFLVIVPYTLLLQNLRDHLALVMTDAHPGSGVENAVGQHQQPMHIRNSVGRGRSGY